MKRFLRMRMWFQAALCLAPILLSYGLQAQWTRQSPLPTGREVSGIQFINPDTGWIFGGEGMVMRTSDRGVNWSDVSLPYEGMIVATHFVESEKGWVACSGPAGRIYYTPNGGMNWTLQFSDEAIEFRDLSFFSALSGWALAAVEPDNMKERHNAVLKTINGGQVWVMSDLMDYAHFSKLAVVSAGTGYIAGAGLPNLMKTTNGGQSWQPVSHPSNQGLTDVIFQDEQNGFTCGSNLYYTHDEAESWGYTYCYYANTLAMYDQENGWTVTINKAFRVLNGGAETEYLFTAGKSPLVGVAAIDAEHAYIAGRHVTLYATHDQGNSWNEISNGTEKALHGLFFLDSLNGWACGADHSLLRTTDGGSRWTYRGVSSSGAAIRDIRFTDALHGWFADGDIYETQDGGETWNKAFDFPDLEVQTVFFRNDEEGFAAGPGEVRKTTDSGQLWQSVLAFSENYLKIEFFDDHSGYLITENRVLGSPDGGWTWNEIPVPGSLVTGPFTDMDFLDPLNGWIAGADFLLRTGDGGSTWESTPGFPGLVADAVCFADESHAWLAGKDGAIFFTSTGGVTATGEKHFPGFSMSVYPNPSAGRIRISCPETLCSVNSTLEIYDIGGVKIVQKNDPEPVTTIEELKPGVYLVLFRNAGKVKAVKRLIITGNRH